MTNGATRVQTVAAANGDGWTVTAVPNSLVVTTVLTLHNMSQSELSEVFTELAAQGMRYSGVNGTGRLNAVQWASLAVMPIQPTTQTIIHSRTVNTSPVTMETIVTGGVTESAMRPSSVCSDGTSTSPHMVCLSLQ